MPAADHTQFRAGPSLLADIVITHELALRPSRPVDHRGENEALRRLMRALGESPRAALRELCAQAMTLCRAESAGVSIAEVEGTREIFRWHATAGGLARFEQATMPREFSPCGVVVESRSVHLMGDMVRHFAYVEDLGIALREVLLVPFFRQGRAVGTIWIVAHSADRHFEAEDLRLMQVLAEATAGIVDSHLKLHELESARAILIANQDALRNAATVAEASTRELERERERSETLAAMLAHDLRTPLYSVKLAFECIQQVSDASSPVLPFALRGTDAVDRIDGMVTEMLDASRARGHRPALRSTRRDVSELVLAPIDSLNVLYAGRIRLALPARPIVVHWDADSIRRVVENLVSNAVKYGAADGLVTVTVRELDGQVAISVHNEGPAIPAADLLDLFGAYTRTGATRGDQNGWGLGLAMVKAAAEAHGGTVIVESTADAGTTFTVRLPIDGPDHRSAP